MSNEHFQNISDGNTYPLLQNEYLLDGVELTCTASYNSISTSVFDRVRHKVGNTAFLSGFFKTFICHHLFRSLLSVPLETKPKR